jgi:hypothetical protein
VASTEAGDGMPYLRKSPWQFVLLLAQRVGSAFGLRANLCRRDIMLSWLGTIGYMQHILTVDRGYRFVGKYRVCFNRSFLALHNPSAENRKPCLTSENRCARQQRRNI